MELSDQYEFETDYGGALTVEFEDPSGEICCQSECARPADLGLGAMKSYKLDWNPGRKAFVLPDTGKRSLN